MLHRKRSTVTARFGGEAFCIRDVQFDDPEIGITLTAAG
jgi:hypothetical protein